MRSRASFSLLALAVLALGAGPVARAESTFGFNTAGTGNVSATARVNISIVVPKVVVLRVGTAGATQDTLTYNARVAIPAAPVNVDGATPGTSGDDTAVTWDGTVPVISVPGSADRTAAAFVWTNGSSVTVNCSATAFAAGGPTLANIAVAAGNTDTFLHPVANLGGCPAGAPGTLTANTLYSGTWTYTLDSTNAQNWAAGAYSTTVTYTAAGT